MNAPESDGDKRGAVVESGGASVRMSCVVAEVKMRGRERKKGRKRTTIGWRGMTSR